MSSDYNADDNDVRDEQSMSKTTRRGALAALGLGGLTMLGSSSASANIAGGPESDEIAHLARPVYEGPEDELPGAGVEGRRYTVTDQGGVYPQYTELRDTGSEWAPINLGVESLDADSVNTGQASIAGTPIKDGPVRTLHVDEVNGHDDNDGSATDPISSVQEGWNRIPYDPANSWEIRIIGDYSGSPTLENRMLGDAKLLIVGDSEDKTQHQLTGEWELAAISAGGHRGIEFNHLTFTGETGIRGTNGYRYNYCDFRVANAPAIHSEHSLGELQSCDFGDQETQTAGRCVSGNMAFLGCSGQTSGTAYNANRGFITVATSYVGSHKTEPTHVTGNPTRGSRRGGRVLFEGEESRVHTIRYISGDTEIATASTTFEGLRDGHDLYVNPSDFADSPYVETKLTGRVASLSDGETGTIRVRDSPETELELTDEEIFETPWGSYGASGDDAAKALFPEAKTTGGTFHLERLTIFFRIGPE